jgi:hypothetical protein
VKRLYWIQFEGYLQSRPELHHTYDSPRHTKLGSEDVAPTDYTAEQLGKDGTDRARWPEIEKALIQRAEHSVIVSDYH